MFCTRRNGGDVNTVVSSLPERNSIHHMHIVNTPPHASPKCVVGR